MSTSLQALESSRTIRVARPEGCDRIALILQGGGALGAYQAGVYQAMHEAGVEPDWVTGVSIGAINCAIIAGNRPERRLERLRTHYRAQNLELYARRRCLPQAAECNEFVGHHRPRATRLFRAAEPESMVELSRRPVRNELLR